MNPLSPAWDSFHLDSEGENVTFDFDRVIERRGTSSLKWSLCDENELPMWVADMDFRAPDAVAQALAARVEHGVFGYGLCPKALREIVVARLARLYDWQVDPEAILFLPGVVPSFNLAIRAFVKPDEGLLIQTPVYPPILRAAEEAGVLSRVEEGLVLVLAVQVHQAGADAAQLADRGEAAIDEGP